MAKSVRAQKSSGQIRHYFVDEGGDSTLFANRGKVIIGKEGCSHFFMLGLLDVADPAGLQRSFDELRARLVNDPYYQNVPSMQANGQKTALIFHAKDDLPEVRKEVFTLLRNTDGLGYFAVVTDKWRVLEYVRQQNERGSDYHYRPNELYDYLARRLFKNLLHKDGGYEIMFARRGAADRTEALRYALETARERFAKQWNITSNAPMHVSAASPLGNAGLQAVDYFTWALQRLYERGEERYLAYVWPMVHLVQDIDDKRKADYGAYYTRKKPLTAAALAWRQAK